MKYYIDVQTLPLNMDSPTLKEIGRTYQKAITEESEHTHSQSWISYENRLISYVEQGDVQGLRANAGQMMIAPRVGYHLKDELLQARYIVVSTLTLLARAAIRGGLGENEAFVLCDAYLQKSAQLQSSSEILQLASAAVVAYTQKVSQLRAAPKYGAVVTFCCGFIGEHLHTNISLKQLANACRLSTVHLSRLFKKETGSTIKQYCLAKKLESAAYLLTYTDQSIQDIALFLGFSSHGRFSGYFKQQYGKTPRQYRG